MEKITKKVYPEVSLIKQVKGVGTQMVLPRRGHTATLLPDGNVLITGGLVPGGVNGDLQTSAAAEIHNTFQGRFVATGQMQLARASHTASLLLNGTLLVTGGGDSKPSFTNRPSIFSASQAEWRYSAPGTLPRRL